MVQIHFCWIKIVNLLIRGDFNICLVHMHFISFQSHFFSNSITVSGCKFTRVSPSGDSVSRSEKPPWCKTDFHQIPLDNGNFTDNSESIMWSKMQIKSPCKIYPEE